MKNVKRNTPNFISNKLLIIIAIFITVLLIAVICYSMGKKELFSSGKELHYYSLSTCPHCQEFDPVWQSFQQKTERCYKYVVDEDDQGKAKADKYNVHSFPTILVIDNGEPVEEVNDRTCGTMREMCNKHNIPCTVVC